MEERAIKAMHDGDAGGVVSVGFAGVEFLPVAAIVVVTITITIPLRRGRTQLLGRDDTIRIVPRMSSATRTSLQIARPLPPQFHLVLAKLSRGGGGSEAADLGDAEDGFPPVKHDGGGGVGRGRVAEAGGGEGAFRPAVVDAGEVPFDFVGGGVAVELVADVDEVLDGGDVDVVDGGEVEDDGLEGGEGGLVGRGAAAAGPGVIPGSVLEGQC